MDCNLQTSVVAMLAHKGREPEVTLAEDVLCSRNILHLMVVNSWLYYTLCSLNKILALDLEFNTNLSSIATIPEVNIYPDS